MNAPLYTFQEVLLKRDEVPVPDSARLNDLHMSFGQYTVSHDTALSPDSTTPKTGIWARSVLLDEEVSMTPSL